jgi:hypothetical protein
VLSYETRLRLLVFLLRLAGTVTMTAFLAMFLPVEWMVSTPRWLGLGEFPRTPVVDYLARSAAALYGFHGALLLLISRDPIKHLTIVRFVACMNVLFGVMIIAIDLHAGMPLVWTLLEGPPIIAFGLALWGQILFFAGSSSDRDSRRASRFEDTLAKNKI